mgnify:CR=1 FL=1
MTNLKICCHFYLINKGPLFYGGELPEEDKEILKGILEQALVVAKIKNKARYTPKKYRQDNDCKYANLLLTAANMQYIISV